MKRILETLSLFPMVMGLAPLGLHAQEAAPEAPPSVGSPEAADVIYIDVLPLFTWHAFEEVGKDYGLALSVVLQHIATANEVLFNSGINNIRFRVVDLPEGTLERLVLHDEDEGAGEDSDKDEDAEAPDSQLDYLMVFYNHPEVLYAMRSEYGADVVVVFTGPESRGAGLSVGVRLVSGEKTPIFNEWNRVICVALDSTDSEEAPTTLIHEVGHLVGCGHSDTQGGTGGSSNGPQTSPDSCGMHAISPGGCRYATVMAYPFRHIDDFSGDVRQPDPRYTHGGAPVFSNPGTMVLDREIVSAGDEGKHNNARVFSEWAPHIAGVEVYKFTPNNDDFASAYEITAKDAVRQHQGQTTYALTGCITMASGEEQESMEYEDAAKNHVQLAGKSVWFRITAPEDGTLRCAVHDADFDAIAIMQVGDDLPSLEPIGGAGDSVSFIIGDISGVKFHTGRHKVQAGQVVYIRVDAVKPFEDTSGADDEALVDDIEPLGDYVHGDFSLEVVFTPATAGRVDCSAAPGQAGGSWTQGDGVALNTVLLLLCGFTFCASTILFGMAATTKKGTRKADASKPGRLEIVYTDGRKEYAGLKSNRITLGRDSSNDIVIKDNSVSGKHAIIRQTDTAVEISDLGSRNGIVVSNTGAVLHQGDSVPLKQGDTLVLGNISIIVH